ncbi:DUF3592 domain-containing protein [Roseomonas eburnea]|uniref:DUF3592 domain-containing protein n=1 Tax=Neoroseomonas eburnea TaxID=1346889 RepID=A0A9X9XHP0_9PROT|nr:DUF3592 domain-containing protein [Neoroseomonas eburnea]MBR0683226.1 DUF3592 domain-containing protein [Neoroseomonas eburnea]
MNRPRLPALLLAGLMLILGAVTVGVGLYAAAGAVAFALRAETAEGQVEKVREVFRRRSLNYVADLRFTTREGAGIRTSARHANGWERFAAGDAVSVRYDPAAPEQAEIAPLAVIILAPLMTLPFGGIFLAFGWALLAPGRARRALPLLAGSGGALVLMLGAFVTANEVEQALARRRATAVAEGTVTGHRQMTRGHADGRAESLWAPTIRFTTEEGTAATFAPSDWRATPSLPVGSVVAVRYRRDAPSRATIDRPLLTWLRPVGVVLAFLLVLAGTGWALRRRRRGRVAARRA